MPKFLFDFYIFYILLLSFCNKSAWYSYVLYVLYYCAVWRLTEAMPGPGRTREDRAGHASYWSADAGHLTARARRAGGRESETPQGQVAGHTRARLQTQGNN